MRISPQVEMIIAIVIIALIALGMVFLLIVPQFGALAEQDQQLSKANQDIQSAQNLLAQRQSAKVRAAQTQTELMKLENQIPDDPQLPALIIELQNAANEAGLDFIKITPDTVTNADGYNTVPISVVLQGRWADCADYVQRLQKLDRQVRISALKVTPWNPSNPSSAVEATNTDVDRNPPLVLQAAIRIEAYTIGPAVQSPSAVPAPAGSSQ